ncbi:unnamed protein product [Calypogeia fissa]
MWCDNTEHARRECTNWCTELDEAVKKGLIKFVGEVGMKKIAFPNNDEPIPLNNNKGGMKALAERRVGKRSVEASTSHVDANVYHLEADDPEVGSVTFKRQLADKIREKTGWDVPVLISSIIMEVDAAWEANMDDKWKDCEIEGESQRKDKRRRDEAGPSTPALAPPSTPPPQPEKMEKPIRKTLGWILGREVDQSVFPKLMVEKFWNQPVQGFTNEHLFGSMRRDIQETILLRSKRKRILKEGPNTMLGNLFEDDEREEANLYAIEAAEAEAAIEELEEMRLVLAYRSDKHRLGGYWARACNECEVELLGSMEDTLKALLDSGLEVNLMSKEVYKEGGWMIDRDINWKVNLINSTKNPLFGACPDVKVKFGNVVEP